LGATTPEQVDVRIVCATHRDLSAMQASGTFRGDLFARLNEYSATLPPLRERKEDVYALCLEFLRQHKRPDLLLSVPYMTGLLHYDFPYNVRELEALIKRGIALAEGGALGASHLSAEIHALMREYGRRQGASMDDSGLVRSAKLSSQRPPSPSWAPPPTSDTPFGTESTEASAIPRSLANYIPSERELRELLAATGGNVAAVGRHFGKERMQVHRWMRRYNIDPNKYR
ncbi:MAG TPA: sigma 54-interacting transcriptional regulator, partial [Polyangiaceae bacterium]|nr:sigma 54-interacting transcriptional regulator [Polyangiaceae bacterium]